MRGFAHAFFNQFHEKNIVFNKKYINELIKKKVKKIGKLAKKTNKQTNKQINDILINSCSIVMMFS